MRGKKGESVKGQGRSQISTKQVGSSHTASGLQPQRASGAGGRKLCLEGVSPSLSSTRLPGVRQGPISKNRHYSFIFSQQCEQDNRCIPLRSTQSHGENRTARPRPPASTGVVVRL